MRCQYCGREISDQSKFCKYCGKSIATFSAGQSANQQMYAAGNINASSIENNKEHATISSRPGFMLAITGMICAGISMLLPVVGALFLGAIAFAIFSCLTSYANIKMQNFNIITILGILVSALSIYMLYIYFKAAFVNPEQLGEAVSYTHREIFEGRSNGIIGNIQYVLYLLFKCM